MSRVYQQGRYEEALKWSKKTYEYANKNFGPKHPDTLNSLNNVGTMH
ncbi:MAG: tetratricopeptide repeat protein, partial [bacterium]|nr:tetratricopeptide repeat protein [bacterium]